MKEITSSANPLIKSIEILLKKSKKRKESQRFILEGVRELTMALAGGYAIDQLLYCPAIIDQQKIVNLIPNMPSEVDLISISAEVYAKVAYRGTTEGVMAIMKTKTLNLQDLQLPNTPLIMVLEAVEKPGNIGALLRTADAANVDAVILSNSIADLYNPNVLRSSVGCALTVQIATATTAETKDFLSYNNIRLFAATLQNSTAYHQQDYNVSTAIAVGNEAHGLSQEMRDGAQHINIPMSGEIDSMNVSVSAAILIFEAKRQRGFKS